MISLQFVEYERQIKTLEKCRCSYSAHRSGRVCDVSTCQRPPSVSEKKPWPSRPPARVSETGDLAPPAAGLFDRYLDPAQADFGQFLSDSWARIYWDYGGSFFRDFWLCPCNSGRLFDSCEIRRPSIMIGVIKLA
jgi:hypothetical protein